MDEREFSNAGAHPCTEWSFPSYGDMPKENWARARGIMCWSALASDSRFIFQSRYPDGEASALVTALSAVTQRSLSLILEDVGEFLVPALMKSHGQLLLPGGRRSILLSTRRNNSLGC